MTSLLVVDEPASHVRRVTLNRPEQLNAMTSELCEALHVALRSIALAAEAGGVRAKAVAWPGAAACP